MKIIELLIILFSEWLNSIGELFYCQYKAIMIILSNPSLYNLKEGLASLCFWIPLDIINIGIPAFIIIYLYKVCKKYFKRAVG